jgi:hypothetical protein
MRINRGSGGQSAAPTFCSCLIELPSVDWSCTRSRLETTGSVVACEKTIAPTGIADCHVNVRLHTTPFKTRYRGVSLGRAAKLNGAESKAESMVIDSARVDCK